MHPKAAPDAFTVQRVSGISPPNHFCRGPHPFNALFQGFLKGGLVPARLFERRHLRHQLPGTCVDHGKK